MSNSYLDKEAFSTAKKLCMGYGISFPEAYKITSSIWEEARRAILTSVDKEDWQKLSFSDKSHVCQRVVRALMDKKKTLDFVSGATNTLL
ncbi:MAG: hypothetical protein ACE5DW_00670 [Thermodesulfobacteriota bacterium]